VRGEGIVRSSAVMAAGTLASRATGFLRATMIAATLGLGVAAADIFSIANTIPFSIYALVAGGVLNSVLVPQLVQSIKRDSDRGEAYSQRMFTAVTLVLFVATVLAVVAAPWLLRLYVSDKWLQPELSAQFDAMVAFSRFCLPQLFFLGLYVLLGMMLNARNNFGPFMWSPVLNNLVVIGVFGAYLLVAGHKEGSTFTQAEVAWLGLGSTFGVALQALILIPVLRKAGLRLRFRRDLRGVGLGKVARLGAWTTLFVVVNQLSYAVVVRLLSSATADQAAGDIAQAGGVMVYSTAQLLVMVPHAVITVSLATALLPSISADVTDRRIDNVTESLASTIRTCLAVILPIALMLAVVAEPLVAGMFSWGAARDGTETTAQTLIVLLPGLIAFTVHFLVLRGFYAFEDTRTPFFGQIALAAVNVGAALALTSMFDTEETAVAVGLAWSAAYIVGGTLFVLLLRRRYLPQLRMGLSWLVMRILLAAIPAAALAVGVVWLGDSTLGSSRLGQLVLAAIAAAAGLVTYALLAVATRLYAFTDVLEIFAKRVSRSDSDGRHVRGKRPAVLPPPSMGEDVQLTELEDEPEPERATDRPVNEVTDDGRGQADVTRQR
jgi:putative peptidoglycan lipid II flippase